MAYDYENPSSANKLSEEFKQTYFTSIQGRETIKAEGLTVLAHEKGVWKFETSIIQYPSSENNFTAICKTELGGYDWDPITKQVREVIYTDIGDANEQNCSKNVAKSFIRMASTRSQARVLRKYTNVDVTCASEMSDVIDTSEPQITTEQLMEIKQLISTKKMTAADFNEILQSTFHTTDFHGLTRQQGNILKTVVGNWIPTGGNKDSNKDAEDNPENAF